MLSAPVKSAKRISSIFSLGSNRDHNDSAASSPQPSPHLPDHSPEHHNQLQPDHQPSPQPTNGAHSPNGDAVGSAPSNRNITPASVPDLDLESPLPPPPSLLDINQDLADSANSPSDNGTNGRGRRRSSASRPRSSGGLSISDLPLPVPRPRTPSSNSAAKRRSWMPGFSSRSESMEIKAAAASTPNAWIAGLDQKVSYDLDPLSRGDQVCNGRLFLYHSP